MSCFECRGRGWCANPVDSLTWTYLKAPAPPLSAVVMSRQCERCGGSGVERA